MTSGKTIQSGYRTLAERSACVQEWLNDEKTASSLGHFSLEKFNDSDEVLTLYCPRYRRLQKRGKYHSQTRDHSDEDSNNDHEINSQLTAGGDLSADDQVPHFQDSRCDKCRQKCGPSQHVSGYLSCQNCERHLKNPSCLSTDPGFPCPGFVVIGGISSIDWDCPERGGTAVWLYNLNAAKWTKLPPLPQPRHNFASCELDDVIYVTGGVHPRPKPYLTCAVDTTFILDPVLAYWCAGPPLTVARSHHKMVAYKGTIWILGGKDHEGQYLNYVEFLGGDCGQWMMGESLPCALAGMCAAIYDGRIFVAGGVVEENGSCTESKATMSFENSRWCYEPPLEHGCFCACMEVVNGCLYMFGGGRWIDRGQNQEKCVSCYSCIVSLNEGQREWIEVQNLRFPCYNMATVLELICIFWVVLPLMMIAVVSSTAWIVLISRLAS